MAIMNGQNILLLEDEANLAIIVKESLETKGFTVIHAATLALARTQYHRQKPDIIIADVMLPDGSGFDFVSHLRRTDTYTPVIFLTARSRTEDVVEGFEQGGNDYLKKPFSIAELIVRIKALLQPNRILTGNDQSEPAAWKIGRFDFFYPSGELLINGAKKQLTSREADILRLLVSVSNRFISRNEVLQQLWGNNDFFSGRSLDVFLSWLRGYFKEDASIKIMNVRGKGYKLINPG